MSDPINPPHYKGNGMEAIDVIEAFDLGYRLGNVVKYVLRAGKKGAAMGDLKKAQWYLEREMALRAGQGERVKRDEPAWWPPRQGDVLASMGRKWFPLSHDFAVMCREAGWPHLRNHGVELLERDGKPYVEGGK